MEDQATADFGQFDDVVTDAGLRVIVQPRTDSAETHDELGWLSWSVEVEDADFGLWVIVLQRGLDLFVVESGGERLSRESTCRALLVRCRRHRARLSA